MRIAILGSGYAGLSVTWHLLFHSQGSATIDMFDPSPMEDNATSLSSGLLHAFPGPRATKAFLGDESLSYTHNLITQASKALNSSVVISHGILRPTITTEQTDLFKQRAQEFPLELEWWEKAKCESIIPGLSINNNAGGLFIKNGLTLKNDAYIEGLWKSCASLGTQLYSDLIDDLTEIQDYYDSIIITPGANFDNLKTLQQLPINKVKGQILEINWPENLNPLPISINANKYLVANGKKNTCILGATFEHNQIEEPNQKEAYQEIIPKLSPFFPFLNTTTIIGCYAGMRVSTSTKKPLIGKISEKVWILVGLGSKGLLYHGIAGSMLAQAVLANNIQYIRPEFLYSQV